MGRIFCADWLLEKLAQNFVETSLLNGEKHFFFSQHKDKIYLAILNVVITHVIKKEDQNTQGREHTIVSFFNWT